MDLPTSSFLLLFLFLTTSAFERKVKPGVKVIDSNLRRLATANNYLAVNIYRQLATNSSGNIFFSPLSLSTAFGMLYYGTRGDTAEELKKALGYVRAGFEEGSAHQTFRKYLTETLPSKNSRAYSLNTANALLLDEELNSALGYKTAVQHYYQASVKDVDFSTQGPQVIHQINEWVKEKTNGKIKKLLDDLDPSTLMVILNAIYFKGTWKKQFDPSKTMLRDFYNNGLESGKIKTATMSSIKMVKYLQSEYVEAVEIPYKGNNISMVLVLPNAIEGLDSLERNLNLKTFSRLRRMLYKTPVLVTIPKFKLEFSRELSREFQSVGAKKVFTPGADFSGITSSDEAIAVGQVFHKAVIEVNEGGTEAAAATAIITPMSLDYFTANHPFLFAIIDRRNDMILFMGRVTNL